jgi:signal transduction histidine kinase
MVAPAVHVEVTDTGSGIPADVIPHVFDYGFTTKPSGQGTGLSLWICREIVQMHGGQIDLRE